VFVVAVCESKVSLPHFGVLCGAKGRIMEYGGKQRFFFTKQEESTTLSREGWGCCGGVFVVAVCESKVSLYQSVAGNGGKRSIVESDERENFSSPNNKRVQSHPGIGVTPI
jgi:hypothetical protein